MQISRCKICIDEGDRAMRTTLNLDEKALASAMKAAGRKTKTAVINEALRDYARRRGLRRLLRLEGKVDWEGDLDALRGRRAARR
jgi:Arc/MetJ family transcription regulator